MRRRQRLGLIRQEEADETLKIPTKEVVFSRFECTKCGREFKRGLFMHMKHCKGNP